MVRLASLLLAVSALSLGGCVAAIIPLAAGGAMASQGTLAGDEQADPRNTPSRFVRSGEEPASLSGSSSRSEGATAQAISATSLPPPGRNEAFEPLRGYDEFHSAVLALAQPGRASGDRSSALLAEPGGSATSQCVGNPPAILIDLDPAGALFDGDAPTRSDPALPRALADLRSEGIAIFWISGRTAEPAGAVKEELRLAGLDPAGDDTLLLMRYPEERKQTPREDIGETHCLLAIAGDQREDFDEMYGYLRDPNGVTAADSLLGERWFLTPNPLF